MRSINSEPSAYEATIQRRIKDAINHRLRRKYLNYSAVTGEKRAVRPESPILYLIVAMIQRRQRIYARQKLNSNIWRILRGKLVEATSRQFPDGDLMIALQLRSTALKSFGSDAKT